MKFSIFICALSAPSIEAQIQVEVQSTDKIYDIISHLLMKQTERLVGLYDTSLLGIAYNAFNWTHDDEYNAMRRKEITINFRRELEQCSFYRTSNAVYVALSNLTAWLDVAYSINSRPNGEKYHWPSDLQYKEVYTCTASVQKVVLTDPVIVSRFQIWLQKAKER